MRQTRIGAAHRERWQRHEPRRHLGLRYPHCVARCALIEAEIAYVSNDPDNLARRLVELGTRPASPCSAPAGDPRWPSGSWFGQ